MGLFRILYALFYLWHVSLYDGRAMQGFPMRHRVDLLIFHVLPANLPEWAYQSLDLALVAALVLLAFGTRTRLVTGVILILGIIREAYPTLASVEEGNLFLVFYIPFFMLVFGHWGSRYSVDARRRTDKEHEWPEWRHMLPARLSLVMLAALFTTSPLYKSFLGGTWLTDTRLITNLSLSRTIDAAGLGLITNPMAPILVDRPALGWAMQIGVLAFEGTFFLALFGRGLKRFYLTLALLFHAALALFMVVTFTPIVIVYALFIDWESLIERARGFRSSGTNGVLQPTPWLAVGIALVVAAAWYAGLRHAFNLWGAINWQTPWFVIGPAAAVALLHQCVTLGLRPSPPTPRSQSVPYTR